MLLWDLSPNPGFQSDMDAPEGSLHDLDGSFCIPVSLAIPNRGIAIHDLNPLSHPHLIPDAYQCGLLVSLPYDPGMFWTVLWTR